ncbi:hypothetical protein HGM15179_010971, partial [Zosterops borbonicus]
YACYEGENSNYFLKFYLITPPEGANDPLFPHQDVVPLIDPCSGVVSPAAGAEQQPSVGRTIESLADYSDRKPHQCPHHNLEDAVYGSAASTSCLMNNVHLFDLHSICCVGAVNFEDTAGVDLVPLNHVQTSNPIPLLTVSFSTPNIPGCTAKVHWSATHPANSNLPSTAPSVIAGMHG